MIESLLPDGTVVKLTDEEFIERFGEERWRDLTGGTVIDPEDMTEGQRYLVDKMQAEQETNEVLAAAGIESLDDLFVEGDEESIALDDLPRQEYDDEGAAADFEESSAAPPPSVG